ncbi:MAG TPA: endonuclease/exonuclease/phosphatase family protein [Polyangiales bacterium]|jgi:endonuclease/exonuclease/phosphatase family metal-dependent hydrolase|nr:endonuclease/exonuclease/phosphatase family protein [Polyangiales bacterium]
MTQLKLLTWNIWMMPRWTFQSPKNSDRAGAIAEVLLERDFDLICLDKLFDGGATDVLKRKLGPRYPYAYGPVNAHGSPFKINGGVMIFSRVPLSELREIQFSASVGIESWSRKGAMLARGSIEGRAFQVLATHLQGDDVPSYQPKHQAIRDQQMLQIAKELLRPHADAALPLFLCGDMCTPRRDPSDPFSESAAYRQMLATFAAANGPEERITLDDQRVHNDLATDDSGRIAELDYILIRQPSGGGVSGSWERVIFQRRGWDGPNGRRDLAYRYAVAATFTL